MTTVSRPRVVAVVFAAFVFLVGLPARPLSAPQQRPLVVEGEAGWLGFADDGIASERMIGAAARWYVSPRIGVGPEVVYVDASNHCHVIVTGNVVYDLLGRVDRRSRRITPFVVAGGGLFRTREALFNGTFTSTEGAFTAGGGLRASAGDRVTIGIDSRVGWELHVRVNGFVGVRLGRSPANHEP
jgi:hypothetical protein